MAAITSIECSNNLVLLMAITIIVASLLNGCCDKCSVIMFALSVGLTGVYLPMTFMLYALSGNDPIQFHTSYGLLCSSLPFAFNNSALLILLKFHFVVSLRNSHFVLSLLTHFFFISISNYIDKIKIILGQCI